MTSLLGIDARYYIQHSTNTDMYTAYCEGVIIGQSFSKAECEYIARKHFVNNSL